MTSANAMLFSLLAACTSCSNADKSASSERPWTARAIELPGELPDGLSGLASSRDGEMWAVAESAHRAVHLDADTGASLDVLPIDGVPAGVELESVAILDDGRFVFGTESEQSHRDADQILVAARSNERLEVVESIQLPYAAWQLDAAPNEGIEAACAAGNMLVVACEAVVVDASGVRAAPLALYDLADETWSTTRIRLTSDSGKISAIACRQHGETIEFVAIERHFEVRRVLRWEATVSELATPSTPHVLVDLSADIADNIEGIEWADGGFTLVVDNYFHGARSGPGKLIRLARR